MLDTRIVSSDIIDITASDANTIPVGADGIGRWTATLAALDVLGQSLMIPRGFYRIDAPAASNVVTINSDIIALRGARLRPDNGVTLVLNGYVSAEDFSTLCDESKGGSVIITGASELTRRRANGIQPRWNKSAQSVLARLTALETQVPCMSGGIVGRAFIEVWNSLNTAADDAGVFTVVDLSPWVTPGATQVYLELCVYIGATLNATTALYARAIGENTGGLDANGAIGAEPYVVAKYTRERAWLRLSPDLKIEVSRLNTGGVAQRYFRINRLAEAF